MSLKTLSHAAIKFSGVIDDLFFTMIFSSSIPLCVLHAGLAQALPLFVLSGAFVWQGIWFLKHSGKFKFFKRHFKNKTTPN